MLCSHHTTVVVASMDNIMHMHMHTLEYEYYEYYSTLEYIIVSWQRGGILVADTQLNYEPYYALVEILDSS